LILVKRYSDSDNSEIKLSLPQGESFILANRIDEDHYEVSVLVPWYGRQFYTGIDSIVIHDELHTEDWQSLFEADTSELISIIRTALPIIKQYNCEEDLEI